MYPLPRTGGMSLNLTPAFKFFKTGNLLFPETATFFPKMALSYNFPDAQKFSNILKIIFI